MSITAVFAESRLKNSLQEARHAYLRAAEALEQLRQQQARPEVLTAAKACVDTCWAEVRRLGVKAER